MRIAFAVLFAAATAHAYELKKDHDGDVVKWTTPLHFVVDASLDDKLHAPGALDAVKAAVATWVSAVPNIDLAVEAGDPSTSFDTITVIDHDWPYDDGVFAVTIIKVDPLNNRITNANIYLNAQQNRFAVLAAKSERGGDKADVQNTVTHEVGHALGLQHEAGHPEACMYPMAYDGDVNKRELSSDDMQGLDVLYPLDTGSTQAPATGCSVSGSTPLLALALAALAVTRNRRRARAYGKA